MLPSRGGDTVRSGTRSLHTTQGRRGLGGAGTSDHRDEQRQKLATHSSCILDPLMCWKMICNHARDPSPGSCPTSSSNTSSALSWLDSRPVWGRATNDAARSVPMRRNCISEPSKGRWKRGENGSSLRMWPDEPQRARIVDSEATTPMMVRRYLPGCSTRAPSIFPASRELITVLHFASAAIQRTMPGTAVAFFAASTVLTANVSTDSKSDPFSLYQ